MGHWCGSVGGVGFTVGVCFLFAVLRCCPPLLRDACPSQSVVGSTTGGGVWVSSPQGAVSPVSSSPGFFAAVWSSPRRQICGVRFSSSSWNLLLDQSFSLMGLLRRFFFALFLGAFVSLRSSEGSFPIRSAFGFGLLAASHGFLLLLTSVSFFLHQFWRLCVWFLLGRGSVFLLLYESVLFLAEASDSFGSRDFP